MSERRDIRADGVEQGSLTLRQLMRAIQRGDYDGPVEYRSIKSGEWLPVAGIMNDFAESDREDDIQEAGAGHVSVLGAGDDCPACSALIGRVFDAAEAPRLPPGGCTCVPWCRCVIIAVEQKP